MIRSRLALLALLSALAAGCACSECDGGEVDWDFVGARLKAQEDRIAKLESEIVELKSALKEACRCPVPAVSRPEPKASQPLLSEAERAQGWRHTDEDPYPFGDFRGKYKLGGPVLPVTAPAPVMTPAAPAARQQPAGFFRMMPGCRDGSCFRR